MRIALPEQMSAALPVMDRLAAGGYEAVFVGGCVRDTLLGRAITDVDIASSAKPEQVMELFERTVPTGIQHGTVTVLHGEMAYEVTTFREESVYAKHRKPESVTFISSLEGDLLRRDLTFNAIALRSDGTVVDPFGGMDDLKNGIVRCVGHAETRYEEDALRMLRMIRFTAEFRFRPTFGTWKALLKQRELLKHIAMERVRMELDKMIAGSSPAIAFWLLARSGLLHHVKEPLPAAVVAVLDAAAAHPDRLGRHAEAIEAVDRLAELDDRWAALLIHMGLTLEEAAAAMKTLRFSGSRHTHAAGVLAVHQEALRLLGTAREPAKLRESWIGIVLRYGEATASCWLSMNEAGAISVERAAASRFKQWLNEMPVFSVKQLDINGRQLSERMDRKPGPWTGQWLERLLYEVACGQLANNRQRLLERAEIWNAEEG
ncbi:CCA tRNA nucleotidyltransferase [Paenibacillus protaetiae]|uniref:CCA tRNA nucleotidyltransferase n=1 Tax=Paenibacillus protaetiae TaxID=2509456 RepID=A0A4P6EVD5_9BACL|nr:CCA tRNA nucleotidyltransferase [Paenibacillus protaetiae]QAY66133.1 CCA tRNA nucleotidyltransferase [Paenibacillus protaetiae]